MMDREGSMARDSLVSEIDELGRTIKNENTVDDGQDKAQVVKKVPRIATLTRLDGGTNDDLQVLFDSTGKNGADENLSPLQ